MGSTHSDIPATNRASGPMRPFPSNRAGRPAGTIPPPATLPESTGAAPLSHGTIPNRNPVPFSLHGHPSVSDTVHPAGRQPKLLDRLGEALHARHYSRRTEQAYCHWVKRFIFFFFRKVRHPGEMAEPEINAFLTHLAVKEKVSASTQTQALSALLFLYRHIIGRQIGNLGEVIRARKPKRLPVVMTREEVKALLSHLQGDKWLMASLMYGAGLRLMECLHLRLQDIDFERREIMVRDGKGAKDRRTMLPESLTHPLQEHLRKVKVIHERDLADGWGRVQMPDALDRKYPSAPADWRWQWVFPQENRWKNLARQEVTGLAPKCRVDLYRLEPPGYVDFGQTV